ncbi:type I inositol polyphosphate 5-phosphatase 10-like isoform X2 [Phragmites australis]|uniref:type I inositol polyphosphate 5-phosphatase 10-like isoform X2 n=1 Tax=Phragmites australis TaxID=29695 RepID=UPI002D76BAE6|nr:type I inositol polyphosphate 5-phosphatase 10-like isoform X2 [Phragmites australis]XP_062204535.1 type I inositol polyphosphate 5-phosphatase 10-like isoform X2 [Phragmites australis]
MDQKTSRRKKFLFPKVLGAKDGNASPRPSTECSINSTVDLKESPASLASPSASSSSSFRSLSESRSLKFSGFNSPATTSCTHTEAFRVFAATWNVAGKTPNKGLSLNDFLPSDDYSDIYVLGFQEVVPLNAGNVLVIEDNEPAARWLALINQALNRPSPSPGAYASAASETAASCSFSQSADTVASASPVSSSSPLDPSRFHKSSRRDREVRRAAITRGRRLKSCTCPVEPPRRSYRAPCLMGCGSKNAHAVEGDTTTSDEEEDVVVVDEARSSSFAVSDAKSPAAMAAASRRERYCLMACKQMVGLFVTVWVRRELVPHVGHVRFSCVGRGIMGYLGNKGCISVSMSLHQTTLCFVCSHLASGEKEGDELRRNSDVVEILKNTQFRRLCKRSGCRIPERILDHDRVIWLGDLNYRIALSYSEAKKLVEANDWGSLFEKDQLKTERESGVFRGWNEGKILFAPTYKYSWNSDNYAGDDVASKKKRRTPAWCDRILWHGEGIVQLSYIRGESKFSDHRPVCGVFIVEVSVLDNKIIKVASGPNMKVGAEELLYTPKIK